MSSFEWRGDALAGSVELAARSAALAGASLIKDEAVQRTPVETGTLRNSAKVDVGAEGGRVRAVVSYNTPYAARQHEEVGWNHPGGGEAKYLENAVTAKRAEVERVIADAIRNAVK